MDYIFILIHKMNTIHACYRNTGKEGDKTIQPIYKFLYMLKIIIIIIQTIKTVWD